MSRVIGTLLPIFANFVIFPCYFFVKSFYAVLTLNNVVFSLSLSFFIVGPLMVYIIEVLLRRVLLNRVPGLHNKATRPSPFLSLSLGDERFLLWLTVVSTHGDSLKNCVFVKHFDVDFWFFFLFVTVKYQVTSPTLWSKTTGHILPFSSFGASSQ